MHQHFGTVVAKVRAFMNVIAFKNVGFFNAVIMRVSTAVRDIIKEGLEIF